jgi:hypothetical protein
MLSSGLLTKYPGLVTYLASVRPRIQTSVSLGGQKSDGYNIHSVARASRSNFGFQVLLFKNTYGKTVAAIDSDSSDGSKKNKLSGKESSF